MKKRIVIAFLAIIGLMTGSCSSDDTGSTSNYQNEIQGNWKESKIVYLNTNKKVIKEEEASNRYGCDIKEVQFDQHLFLELLSFRPSADKECVLRQIKNTFTLDGNSMEVEYVGDDYIELNTYTIVQLNQTKLAFENAEQLLPLTAEYAGYPKGTAYIRTVYVRK